MPEPGEDVLAEVTLGGRQEEPWTRRVCADGAVWEHTALRTWVEDGAVRQERTAPRWEHVTDAPPQGLELIRDVIRRFDLLSAAPGPSPTATFGVGTIRWRLGLDGRTHEIELDNVPPEQVPGLTELDEAVQVAVAMGVEPD